MIRINEKPVKINTPSGVGELYGIEVTELGYIKVKVYFKSNTSKQSGHWTNYIISDIKEILKNTELSLVKEDFQNI